MASNAPLFTLIYPEACQDTVTNAWTSFTWTIFQGLTDARLVLPPIAGLIIVPWFFPASPARKWVSSTGWLLLLLYLWIGSPLGVELGDRLLTRPLPSDSGTPADAIVVLGRGSELRPQRVDLAARLWRDGRAPLVFVSGRGDAPPLADMLLERGLPPEAIDGESCSRTTEENAQFTALLLDPNRTRRIVLVTDPPHMLRSLLTFRSLGFEVIPQLSPFPDTLGYRKKGLLLLREYLGLPSYGLLGRFFQREISATMVAMRSLITRQTPPATEPVEAL